MKQTLAFSGISFDIDATIKDMLAAAKGQVATGWNDIKKTAEGFLQNKKKRLNMLADYRLSNEINDEELLSFLNDEKTLLASEVAALKVISKAVAQKAANAALDVLYNAIKKLIGLI